MHSKTIILDQECYDAKDLVRECSRDAFVGLAGNPQVNHASGKARGDNVRFYVDTCAERHIVQPNVNLKNLRRVSSQIQYASGPGPKLRQEGDLNLGNVYLQDVLQGDVEVNLMSVACLADAENAIGIFHKDGGLLLSEDAVHPLSREGNLYELNQSTFPSKVFFGSCWQKFSDDVIHHCLGHASDDKVSRIIGRSLSRDHSIECRGCCLGKLKTRNHKSGSRKDVSRIHDRLRVDTVHAGVFSAGYRYFCVVVDEFSRFSWVLLLREKSEASLLLQQLITRLNNQSKFQVLCVQRDGGTEFHTAQGFLKSLGIQEYITPPYDHLNNSVVERINFSLC